MARVFVLVLVVLSVHARPAAQNPAATKAIAAFEAASIRRNTSGSLQASSDDDPGGRVTAINFTLRDLLLDVYGLREAQLLGGPSWFDRDQFDIVAKAPPNTSDADKDAMMRGLLASRFRLAVHWEQREMPVYELVLARPDRRLGANLRPRPDCAESEVRESARAPCGGVLFGPGRLTVRGQSITQFGPGLARDRIVIDRTGLQGRFDVDLEWMPLPSDLPPGAPLPSDDRPPLVTALQDQLGLKLQPARATIDVLVVDRAEPPSEN